MKSKVNSLVTKGFLTKIPLLVKILLVVTAIFTILLLYTPSYKFTSYIAIKREEMHSDAKTLRRLENKSNLSPDEIFFLAEKHYHGIPDIVGKDGTIFSGRIPDIKKAQLYYISLRGTVYHYHSLIPLGDIYNYGDVHNETMVDKTTARTIYIQALDCPINNIRLEAMEKIQNINEELGKPRMDGIIDISTVFNKRETVIFEKPPKGSPNVPVQKEIVPTIKNDTQNVHDPSVVKSIRLAISNIKNNIKNIISEEDTIIQINMYIKELQPEFKDDHSFRIKVENAKRALITINTVNARVENANMNERELLSIVWSYINELESKDCTNSRYNLYLQLCECIEHNIPVCAQGRFNHILGSIEDPTVSDISIKPLWAIKQEMLNKSSVIRDRNEQLDDNALRYLLKDTFKQEYMDIVSPELIDIEIDSWFI